MGGRKPRTKIGYCDQSHSSDQSCSRQKILHHQHSSRKRMLFPLQSLAQTQTATHTPSVEPQIGGSRTSQILVRSANLSVSNQRYRCLQEPEFRVRGVHSRKGLQLSRSNVARTSKQIYWARVQSAKSRSVVVADRAHCSLRDNHLVLQELVGCWSCGDGWSPRCISCRYIRREPWDLLKASGSVQGRG